MKFLRRFASLVLFIAIANSLYGQGLPTIFECSLMAGKPIKHSPELLFEANDPSYGLRIAHYWQTTGKDDWQVRHHHPRIGLSASWLKIGDSDILGSAFSIAPEISFGIITRPAYEFRATVGYGLGILNRIFDYRDNPTNNAVSAKLNVSVLLKLDQAFRLNPNWQLSTSFAFSHFSNGARHLPNFGINIANFQLGLQYRQGEFERSNWNHEREASNGQLKWGLDLQTGLGYREREESRGPAYPIYTVSGALVYKINVAQAMRLGFSWERNQGAYLFGRHIILFTTEEEARQKSQRRMIFYAHEFRLGNFGINIWMGTYLAKKQTGLLPGSIFNTIEIRYYLPRVQKLALQPYVSFNMKSHITRAEYLSLRVGTLIGK